MKLGFWFALLTAFLGPLTLSAQWQSAQGIEGSVPDSCWADSVLYSLSLEEKIGQLIFARANKDNILSDEIPDLIRKYNIGGVVFFKGSPYKQVQATNAWQGIAKTPLFVSIDAERGLAMRLDSTFGFPYMMTLGACSDDSLVYAVATEIARGCKRMGIHINFGPVADINSNPRNPVINSRSFGEDKEKVARKSIMYMKGLQSHNIMHTAKHFPGHGDTDSDSHYTLPVVKHSLAMLDSLDLYPYQQLLKVGLEGVMAAHVFVPSLDSASNAASSLSYRVITKLLKEKMHFSGLVFTDALEMKGVTNYYQPGEIEVKAFLAGNDILLMPQNVNRAVASLKQAVDSCWIWPEDIDERVLKILKFKQKYIPHGQQAVLTKDLTHDLNPVSNEVLYRKIMASALTLVKNDHDLIPFCRPDTLKLACVIIGSGQINSFQETLGLYSPLDYYCIPANASPALIDSIALLLMPYDYVITGVVNTSIYPDKNFGLTASGVAFLACLQEQNKIILTFFGNPYAIGKTGPFPAADAIIVAYQDNEAAYQLAAQAIFGANPLQGHLPVSAADGYPVNSGIRTVTTGKLKYVLPEECGLSSDSLAKADSVIMDGIRGGAYPGCQVLAAWKGRVFYHKAFGRQSWGDSVCVHLTDLYDLASVTKVAGTTLAVMRLYEEGKIDLDEHLSVYLPELKRTNKRNIIIRDLLAHQAGLKSWIPFYLKLIRQGKSDTLYLKDKQDSIFTLRVAENLYLKKDFPDTIKQQILSSPVSRRQEYKYSDLGFYLLKEMIEHITGEPLEAYLERNFYKPLGLSTLTYNPVDKFPLSRIIPTEDDTVFRQQKIRGYVHDPGAALLGGVAGHAGLFSDANDLGILMQMLVNGGVYGEHRYFKTETVREFCAAQFPEYDNRRGLGFDKPLLDASDDGPSCASASPSSFGHSGFTGTYVWGDPDNELVYVFLCNRVNPDASNHKLTEMNIRTRVHEIFYQQINQEEEKEKTGQ